MSDTIRNLRMEKGISIRKLADVISVNYVFLSRVERGLEKPSEELIKKIAKALEYEGNINELIVNFGKVPKDIEKLIIEDPSSVVELPAFFKSRKKSNKEDK